MRFIQDIDVSKKTVLVRVDFNVPIKNGKILDNSRIKAAIPTINYLIKNRAKILLLSHLGDPKGKRIGSLSLKPVSEELSKLLKKKVEMLKDCISPFIISQIDKINPGEVFMLENVRFYKGEEKNESFFARKLASLADVYVNEAFSVCHRNHASLVQLPRLMPSCAGFLLQKEVNELNKILNPKKPFVLLLGGAKVSDKLSLAGNLIEKSEKILVGGAMIFPFLKIKKYVTGKNRVDKESLIPAKYLLAKYKDKIVLPSDLVVAEEVSKSAKTMIVEANRIPKDCFALDIGPRTIKTFKVILKKAETIFWNGPLGYFEIDKFAKGTSEIAEFLSKQKNYRVVGGGETLSAVKKYSKKYSHLSTGGGACLDFLSGKELPGIKALR